MRSSMNALIAGRSEAERFTQSRIEEGRRERVENEELDPDVCFAGWFQADLPAIAAPKSSTEWSQAYLTERTGLPCVGDDLRALLNFQSQRAIIHRDDHMFPRVP